jgi:hypothetical protein
MSFKTPTENFILLQKSIQSKNITLEDWNSLILNMEAYAKHFNEVSAGFVLTEQELSAMKVLLDSLKNNNAYPTDSEFLEWCAEQGLAVPFTSSDDMLYTSDDGSILIQ